MPERTGFASGEFAWTDLMTSDLDAAVTFYRTVFGWEAEQVQEPEARGYTMFSLGGRQVGAASPLMPGDPSPPRWNVYVGVADTDVTLKAVEAAGGSVIVPAMDVFTAGRMGMAADPAGAVFALWQAGDHTGAGVTDEPGTLTWVELSTTDTEGAKAFYADVFGWGEETADGGGMPYTEFKLGGKSIAGMMPAQGGMPPFWMPYFQVTDPDKVAGEVAALGGQVLAPPDDIPGGQGRYAVVTDPQGAPFGLYRP
jgi:hypothetical protein